MREIGGEKLVKDKYEEMLDELNKIEDRIKNGEKQGIIKHVGYTILTLTLIIKDMRANIGLTKEVHLVLAKSDKLSKIAFIVGMMSLVASGISLIGSSFILQIPFINNG